MMYRLNQTGVIETATGDHIPPIKSDTRWAAYQAWVKAGGVPLPAQVYEVPLDDIRARLVSDIHAERARRHDLPIAYHGAVFDAGAETRENLLGLISRLLRGSGIPEGWVGWRDEANVLHWGGATPADLLAALSGLSGAIENRKQALMVASWVKKAELPTLDRAGLLAYDVLAGWPE